MSNGFTIFAGTANPTLAGASARALGVQLGACAIDRFPDGEVAVQLLEPVRRKEVFLVQPTSPPVDQHLMELLALVDACRRAAAARITAIVPYFGYARADKRHGRREPITARVAADLLEAVGIAHVVTVDPHTPQIEGFFHAPVDSLTAVPTLCRALRHRLPPDVVVVSPDGGRMQLATRYAQCLGTPVVVLHKRRESGTETEVTHDPSFGFDAQSGEYRDLVKAGIIDPSKVVRTALQGAASVAGLLVTTEALVAEKPEPKPAGQAPAGADMDF